MDRALILKVLGFVATAIITGVGAVYTANQDADVKARDNASAAYEATATAVRELQDRIAEIDRRLWELSQRQAAMQVTPTAARRAVSGSAVPVADMPTLSPPSPVQRMLPSSFDDVYREAKLRKGE